MCQRTSIQGFTLIEILITTGIVATLVTIAWPTWNHAMHKARRTEAHIDLLMIQHAQERHYASQLTYAGTLQKEDGLGLAEVSESGDYRFELDTSDDGQQYSISATATPEGRQQGDRSCRKLTVDESGHRTALDSSGTPSSRCW